MVRRLFVYALSILFIFAITDSAFAKNKKKKKPKKNKGIEVSIGDYFSIPDVPVKIGSKTKKKTIYCLDNVPGIVKSTPKGLMFTSFKKKIKSAKKNGNKAKQSEYAAMQKAGKSHCKNPPFADLDPYTGPFGAKEARLLYNRFAFGATTDQINLAVSEGLAKTVERLTTPVAQPALDQIEKDLQCDGRLPDDENNETCDPTNPNDLSTDGVRYGLYYRMLHSTTPFFEKLFFFAHDERLATSSVVLDSCERHALIKYVDAVRSFALSGNYKKYMDDMNNSHLIHLNYLDGEDNAKDNPNENYAREFWELGTVGPTDLNGNPVYSSLDIINSALTLTGGFIEGKTVGGHWFCYSGFSSDLHYEGPKVVFAGTPYQAIVEDMDDLLNATFAHPRTAEHLAEDIWKEFINPFIQTTAIKELAAEIRNNGYNLLPVFRKIMKSKAMFSETSRMSLIKHPVDLLIGFLRTTGMPLDLYYLDQELRDMGQRPLRADTVFGWNEEALAGEAFVLPWRNTLLMLMTEDDDDLEEEGYDLHAKLISGSKTAEEVIKRVSGMLGLDLNATQTASLVNYLNYNLEPCSWGHQSECSAGQSYLGQGEYFLDKDLYDPDKASDNWWKVRGLTAILGMLPEYRMK